VMARLHLPAAPIMLPRYPPSAPEADKAAGNQVLIIVIIIIGTSNVRIVDCLVYFFLQHLEGTKALASYYRAKC